MQLDDVYAYALEHSPNLVLIYGADGIICYANQAAKSLLEYEDDLIQQSITQIFPGEDSLFAPLSAKDMNAYRRNRTCFPVKGGIFEKKQGENWVFCLIATDSSETVFLNKQMEKLKEETEVAARTKAQFVANITHELRTPVNGILGNTRELVEIETEREKQKRLALIERGCADMNAIINNILDFSKLEAGKFTLEPREFVFRDMIEYVQGNHKNKASEKGLDLLVTVADDIPEKVIGDELRIVQILNNLLSNAVKFTSVGRVALEVFKTAQMGDKLELFFLVIDTGIGIDALGREKLFQSFSQVDASISRRFGGTGLGLNISKQLVELMDGSIQVESEEGKGSMFSFHIWVKQSGQESDAPPMLQEIHPTSIWDDNMEDMWKFGTKDNTAELKKKLNRLILAAEMDNWEKAESFSDTAKKLTDTGPREVKQAMLRLKMAVQKEEYEKTMDAYRTLLGALAAGGNADVWKE